MNDTPEKTFSRDEIDALRAAVQAYREETTPPRTWGRLADQTGVNEKTLAAWVPGTYDKGEYWKNQTIPAQVARFLATLEERASLAAQMPRRLGFQNTPSARRIMTCLAMAQLNDMAMIATAPGCGKTVACKQFRQTRANVFLATVSRGCGGPADVLGAILEAMGDQAARGTIGKLKKLVIEKLQGADGLLIVDEAQYCTAASLEELRAIHDATDCGLALVGDDKLPGLLRGHAQLHSRIGISHVQRLPEPGDLDVLAAAWEVEDAACLTYLRTIGSKPGVGGLRRVDKVIRLATMQARSADRALALPDLKDAFAQRYSETV